MHVRTLAASLVVIGSSCSPTSSVRGRPSRVPSASVVCNPGAVAVDGRCEDIAVTLHGLRWQLPCSPEPHGDVCAPTNPRPTQSTRLGGRPDRTYDVTLRFRGVVEQNAYRDGTATGSWYAGGRSADAAYNIYALRVSAPATVYFLNAGEAGIRRTFAIDYTRTIRISGGATVTLDADAQDGRLISNRDDAGQPIIVPDVPPAPAAMDGQFIQMDVVRVSLAPPPQPSP